MRTALLTLIALVAACGAEVYTDIEYARPDNVSLKMDISVPDGAEPRPAVILIHGGAFVEGSRRGMTRLADTLGGLDVVVVSIDYRLAPQYKYPAAVDDVGAAVHWVRTNAARYRIDPSRLALIGQSAGGYLAAMAAVRGAEVSALALFYPIGDVVRTFDPRYTSAKMRADRSRFFGVEELTPENAGFLRAASPYHNVRPGMPPWLLLHGTADKRVDYEQSVAMCKKLTAIGNRCELITVPNGGHGNWKDPDWKEKLLTWLSTQLGLVKDGRRESAQSVSALETR